MLPTSFSTAVTEARKGIAATGYFLKGTDYMAEFHAMSKRAHRSGFEAAREGWSVRPDRSGIDDLYDISCGLPVLSWQKRERAEATRSPRASYLRHPFSFVEQHYHRNRGPKASSSPDGRLWPGVADHHLSWERFSLRHRHGVAPPDLYGRPYHQHKSIRDNLVFSGWSARVTCHCWLAPVIGGHGAYVIRIGQA